MLERLDPIRNKITKHSIKSWRLQPPTRRRIVPWGLWAAGHGEFGFAAALATGNARRPTKVTVGADRAQKMSECDTPLLSPGGLTFFAEAFRKSVIVTALVAGRKQSRRGQSPDRFFQGAALYWLL